MLARWKIGRVIRTSDGDLSIDTDPSGRGKNCRQEHKRRNNLCHILDEVITFATLF
jgi:hypothetical protein